MSARGKARPRDAECIISRQDSHRAEAAAVRGLGRAGWLRTGGMRGRKPAPAAAAAAPQQPTGDRVRNKKEKKKWEEVCILFLYVRDLDVFNVTHQNSILLNFDCDFVT